MSPLSGSSPVSNAKLLASRLRLPRLQVINLVQSLDYRGVYLDLPPGLGGELPPAPSARHVPRGGGEHRPLLAAIGALHKKEAAPRLWYELACSLHPTIALS